MLAGPKCGLVLDGAVRVATQTPDPKEMLTLLFAHCASAKWHPFVAVPVEVVDGAAAETGRKHAGRGVCDQGDLQAQPHWPVCGEACGDRDQ